MKVKPVSTKCVLCWQCALGTHRSVSLLFPVVQKWYGQAVSIGEMILRPMGISTLKCFRLFF